LTDDRTLSSFGSRPCPSVARCRSPVLRLSDDVRRPKSGRVGRRQSQQLGRGRRTMLRGRSQRRFGGFSGCGSEAIGCCVWKRRRTAEFTGAADGSWRPVVGIRTAAGLEDRISSCDWLSAQSDFVQHETSPQVQQVRTKNLHKRGHYRLQ